MIFLESRRFCFDIKMIRCARCRSSKLSNSKSNPDFYQFTLVCDTTMLAMTQTQHQLMF